MKRMYIIVLLIALSLQAADSREPGRISNVPEFYMELLDDYDRDGYNLVKTFLDKKDFTIDSFFGCVTERDRYELLYVLPFIVHETSHIYNATDGGRKTAGKFSIAKGKYGYTVKSEPVRISSRRTSPVSLKKNEYKGLLKKIKNKEDAKFFENCFTESRKGDKYYLTTACLKKHLSRYNRVLEGAEYFNDELYNYRKRFYDHGFYIGKKNNFTVKYTKKYFWVPEIARNVPKELREFKYSRFKIYIDTKDQDMVTRRFGAYGMLDEFCAFFNGTRTAIKLYKYYKKKLPLSVNTWYWFLKTANWHYWSYYDFKYYIYQYMLHAKKMYPDVYSETFANREFREAFREADKAWQDLIEEYGEIKKDLYSHLRKEGITVDENDEHTVLTRGKEKKTLLNFNFIIKRFRKELQKKQYRRLL